MKIVVLCLVLTGCTSLTTVSVTSVPAEKGKKVSAKKSKMIYFGFNFNNDYLNDMVQDLAGQCPKGKIQGLLTKHEHVIYFPIVAHEQVVSSEGYCN